MMTHYKQFTILSNSACAEVRCDGKFHFFDVTHDALDEYLPQPTYGEAYASEDAALEAYEVEVRDTFRETFPKAETHASADDEEHIVQLICTHGKSLIHDAWQLEA